MKLKTLLTATSIALITAACQSPATDRLTSDTAADTFNRFSERSSVPVMDSIRPYQQNRSDDPLAYAPPRDPFQGFNERGTPPRDSTRPYQSAQPRGDWADTRPADVFNRFKERSAPPRDSARPYQYNPVITRF